MHVTQTFAAALPVEEVVAFIYILRGQADALPGLEAGTEFFAVEELPGGEEKASARGEEGVDSVEELQAQFAGGEMMKSCETSDQ